MRWAHATVIMPIAFTNLAYLREFMEGAHAFDDNVRHFCLTAPIDVVLGRLVSRPLTSEWRRRHWERRM
jgi:hypothetical protein